MLATYPVNLYNSLSSSIHTMQSWRNKLWTLLLHSGIRISFLFPVPFKVCCLSSRLQSQSDSGSIEAHTKVNAINR